MQLKKPESISVSDQMLKECRNARGMLHAVDEPALVRTYRNKKDKIVEESWYWEEREHRIGGPAFTRSVNGKVAIECYYNNGQKHRENGPAVIIYNNDGGVNISHYYLRGVRHREDGPAIIVQNKQGRITREVYMTKGRRQRAGGPAVINYDKNGNVLREEYRKNEMLHREDGPAVIEYEKKDVREQYWFEGRQLKAENAMFAAGSYHQIAQDKLNLGSLMYSRVKAAVSLLRRVDM